MWENLVALYKMWAHLVNLEKKKEIANEIYFYLGELQCAFFHFICLRWYYNMLCDETKWNRSLDQFSRVHTLNSEVNFNYWLSSNAFSTDWKLLMHEIQQNFTVIFITYDKILSNAIFKCAFVLFHSIA